MTLVNKDASNLEELNIVFSEDFSTSPIDKLLLSCDSQSRQVLDRNENRIPQFQAADGYIIWQLLNIVKRQSALPNDAFFCELGSGIGLITMIASIMGMQARGIEIESELVEIARTIATESNISAKFFAASMFPDETPSPPAIYDQTDLFFVYPWPPQVESAISLFQAVAKPGAILICYRGGLQYRILRQTI